MQHSVIRRTRCGLAFTVLVAALCLVAAPAGHATWRTGNGHPPAWNDEHVCVNGIDWTFAWFAPVVQPDSEPPSQLFIAVGEDGRRPLVQGVYDLPPRSPLQLTHTDIDSLPGFEWRRGKEGLFDIHATFRIAFQPGVQVPVGTQVAVTWQWSGGQGHMVYTAARCNIEAFSTT